MNDTARVCIVGSGMSGLSAAFLLSRHRDVEITVYERDGVFGGRANVDAGGEHCPRVFLGDYVLLFDMLRAIPDGDGRTLFDALHRPRRYFRTARHGWREISHMYALLSKELPLSEKLRIVRRVRRSPLVAEQGTRANTNRYGSMRNYSFRSLTRLSASVFRSRRAYVLDGPTDTCLTGPWVDHLADRGVTLHRDAPVEAIHPAADGVRVRVGGRWEHFDAVVVAAFVSDTADLLTASGIGHRLRRLEHIHCKSFTLTLDPAEKILTTADRPAVYCYEGVNLLLQPRQRRCVVLCIRSASTAEDYVLGQVREHLGLEHDLVDVHVRDNQKPREAVYSADYVDRNRILRHAHPRLYFAGSYLRNSYPVDSAEAAARSAFDAVRQLRHDLALADTSTDRKAARP
ncbi:FAD-dependent oxidoreductase [Virgisporangium aurantiacum]|uniref:FAD dependent oxidoreductase domain-containing protein n=1 Tax=Virgisporangium aurantiacum TaxID=175570 RepID=A0A8J3Z660_9ACTN|nr:FAD-dependent oxidoreductase [Virgisporangium aurantiacum]GIJ57127.1 hypothetical protein Vau01_046430 [Virgisporangium aurantiacum]